MAKLPIKLPECIGNGSQVSILFLTQVIKTLDGKEQRIAMWRNPKRGWDLAYGVGGQDDIDALVAAFNEAQGEYHTFEFENPLDLIKTPMQMRMVNSEMTGQPVQYSWIDDKMEIVPWFEPLDSTGVAIANPPADLKMLVNGQPVEFYKDPDTGYYTKADYLNVTAITYGDNSAPNLHTYIGWRTNLDDMVTSTSLRASMKANLDIPMYYTPDPGDLTALPEDWYLLGAARRNGTNYTHIFIDKTRSTDGWSGLMPTPTGNIFGKIKIGPLPWEYHGESITWESASFVPKSVYDVRFATDQLSLDFEAYQRASTSVKIVEVHP